MDPRHPELVLPRIKELIKQYDTLLKELSEETVSYRLAELERKGSLIVTELCLVAPRLHDNLMSASRQRRSDLAKGILIEPQDTAVELPVEKPVEKAFHRADIVTEVEDSYKVEEPKSRRRKLLARGK